VIGTAILAVVSLGAYWTMYKGAVDEKSGAADNKASSAPALSTEDTTKAKLIKRAESGDYSAWSKVRDTYPDVALKDYAEVVRGLPKVAAQGDAVAQSNLGNRYAEGKNYTESARWYRMSAEQGDAHGQYSMGWSYEFGNGVPKDGAEAARWYRKSAEQGYTHAQEVLGGIYAHGDGVLQDDVEGYFWWNLAASAPDMEYVQKLRDEVGAKLTPEKRLEVQERCRKWAEAHPPSYD